MAFSASEMVLMAHGNNVKLYTYESTSDTLATIEAADYFDSFGDQIRAGDIIMVKGSDGSRMLNVTTGNTTDVVAQAYEGMNSVFAHDLSTSIATPASGVVTFTPTSVLGAPYVVPVPHPGATLTLVDLTGTTSIIVNLVGPTTSVITFGQGTNNKVALMSFGAVELVGLSATKWGVRGFSNTDVTTSLSDVQFLN